MWMKKVISIVIFTGIFDIIFTQLIKIKPELFSIFDIIPKKLKGKKTYEWIALLIIMLPYSIISVHFNLNYIIDGIIVGFIFNICSFAFREPKVIK